MPSVPLCTRWRPGHLFRHAHLCFRHACILRWSVTKGIQDALREQSLVLPNWAVTRCQPLCTWWRPRCLFRHVHVCFIKGIWDASHRQRALHTLILAELRWGITKVVLEALHRQSPGKLECQWYFKYLIHACTNIA